jgi:hypothetical protein
LVQETLLMQRGQQAQAQAQAQVQAQAQAQAQAQQRGQHGQPVERPPVPSARFSPAHALRSPDLERELQPLLERRCVRIGRPGEKSAGAEYDFSPAQDFLLDLWRACPGIDLELRAFGYTLGGGGGGDVIASLRQKVPQVALPRALADAVGGSLGASASQAAACLRLVDTAIAFLQGTGGSAITQLGAALGSTSLSAYLQEVLLMRREDVGEPAVRAVAQQVQLQHLAAVWQQLRECTGDVLAAVRPKYRAALPDGARAALLGAVGAGQLRLPLLLPVLGDFLSAQLVEDHTSAAMGLKDMLGYCTGEDGEKLVDLPWFEENFPSGEGEGEGGDGLLMMHALEAYRLLVKC